MPSEVEVEQLAALVGGLRVLAEEEPEDAGAGRAAHDHADRDGDEKDDHDDGCSEHGPIMAPTQWTGQPSSPPEGAHRRGREGSRRPRQLPMWAQASISTRAPIGSSATPMAERAGR